jgi:2-polyprenyl-3-methyl-5-hydroxy-6-metoxy-1,4-benzoquinol methylase
MNDNAEHWNAVYAKRSPQEVSWFQAEARGSLDLIEACNTPSGASIIDVGAGASTLVDGLLTRGFTDITLLDIATTAFVETRARLPDASVEYVVADVARWSPPRSFDIWHDRAVFHFLTDVDVRSGYRSVLSAAVPVGGHVILGTFALDGPERCSGLSVRRYSAESLAAEFTGVLSPVEHRLESHVTPGGTRQAFVFVRFQRV